MQMHNNLKRNDNNLKGNAVNIETAAITNIHIHYTVNVLKFRTLFSFCLQ